MKIFEELFDLYLSSLYQEGKRVVECKSLSLLLGFIRILKRISLVFLVFVTATMQLSAGFFVLLVEVMHQFQIESIFEINRFIVAGIALVIFGYCLLIWSLKEKHWLAAFDIQKRIAQIDTKIDSESKSKTSIELTDMDKKLSDLIDRKIEKYFESMLEKEL